MLTHKFGDVHVSCNNITEKDWRIWFDMKRNLTPIEAVVFAQNLDRAIKFVQGANDADRDPKTD